MDGSLITPRFYFSLDKDDCVINSSAPDKVDEIYKSLIKEVTQGISSKFGQKLHSLMVRGSISSGRAKPNISDADLYSYKFINGDFTTERELKLVRKNMVTYIHRNTYYLLSIMNLEGSPKTNINRDKLKRFVSNFL